MTEVTLDLNKVLQDLGDVLQIIKTTSSHLFNEADQLEARLYAAHDRLIERFASAREMTDESVIIMPNDTLDEFRDVRNDIIRHAQTWMDDKRRFQQ